jgi:hypothetical protein
VQVARDRFPVPARPLFSVEKVDLFCNPASGVTFSSTAIEIKQELNSSVSSCDKARRGGKIYCQYCSDLNGLEWRKFVFD